MFWQLLQLVATDIQDFQIGHIAELYQFLKPRKSINFCILPQSEIEKIDCREYLDISICTEPSCPAASESKDSAINRGERRHPEVAVSLVEYR